VTRSIARIVPILLTCGCVASAAEVTTIKAYVDTDVCSHLLLGPITDPRVECSKKAIKEGISACASPVV
jgi:hypothetical protein